MAHFHVTESRSLKLPAPSSEHLREKKSWLVYRSHHPDTGALLRDGRAGVHGPIPAGSNPLGTQPEGQTGATSSEVHTRGRGRVAARAELLPGRPVLAG